MAAKTNGGTSRGTIVIEVATAGEIQIMIDGEVNQNDLILASHYLCRTADVIIDRLMMTAPPATQPPKLAIARSIPKEVD